jgi:hypothetical protein
VDPVPDSLILRIMAEQGTEPETPGSVARNSDHYNTEDVSISSNIYYTLFQSMSNN